MTPIEKNIIVVDEQGNEYEATYPKRARGLVKHGRARFIGENTICLAYHPNEPAGTSGTPMCPPNIDLEDEPMSEDNTPALTMAYVLQKLDQLANDTPYLQEAIAALKDLKSDPAFADNPAGDNAGAGKANALSQIVKCRETTNQQFIALYAQMYQDLKVPNSDYKVGQLRQILETFSATEDNEKLPYMENIAMKMLGLTANN